MPSRTALLLICLSVTACSGGGGGGGGAAPPPVSAGSDRTVAAGARVYLVPSARPEASVQTFVWEQRAGPEAALEPDPFASPGALVLRAPAFDATLQFEVTGVRLDGSVAGTDRVIVAVEADRDEASGTPLSKIEVRGGGPGRALASALHEQTQRLFVIDGVAGDVLCYDVSDPEAPAFVGALPIPDDGLGFQAGSPLAVACGREGPVAITWSGETIKFPGRMQFVDPVTLRELRSLSTVGVRPVDIDASDDGNLFAVACSGDRDFFDQADGLGYVTLVTVPPAGAGSIQLDLHVTPIPLTAFDGDEAALLAAGVRFPSPRAQASLSLAPRAIAIAPDASIVWVACPENDAVITIDPATKLAAGITALPDRPNGDLSQGTALVGSRRTWTEAPTLMVSPAGDVIRAGGVAGVMPPVGATGFRFVSGSGPTLAPVDLDGDGELELPFVDADAQLEVVELLHRGDEDAIGPLAGVPLVGPGGAPVTGGPGLRSSAPGLAGHEEQAVDLFGAPVPLTDLGGRFEGVTETTAGEIWLADSRRSALWRFDASGALVARYVPEGTPGALGIASLPGVYAQRRVNLDFPLHRRFGGFGAIAFDATRGSILAIPRMPLDNPDGPEDLNSAASRILRVLEFDVATEAAVGEYVYVLEAVDHAVEGLAVGDPAIFDGGLGVLEAGAGPRGMRAVFDVDLDGATNLRDLSMADYAAVSPALETIDPAGLEGLAVPIVPVRKRLAIDLAAAGFGGSARPSGLTMFGAREVVVGFDDGFDGVATGSFDQQSGAIARGARTGSFFVRGTIEPLRFDTSSDGLPAPAANGVPAIGLPQPLDLVAIGAGDRMRVVAANGGRPRVLPSTGAGPDSDERVRAASQVLDTNVFPGASLWQRDPFGGDLIVSGRDADLDENGLVDRLAIFGSRSISVLDPGRRTTWTSSSLLNDAAREARPEAVDAAATTYGIRPRALARTTIGGRGVVATAFESAGLVGLHLVDAPDAPLFAGFVASGGAPCDLDLAAAAGASSALMAITDRDAGAVSLVRVEL
ncbi:MAG: esterase-like activity of phytase family protein [Planctomycetota bacterium]|nr:esterase-like activity of phytase family protein [Planctomycetota bacterium]